MKTLVISAVLLLTLSLLQVGAVAGEPPGSQALPGGAQPVNENQLDQLKGGVGNQADYSQVSRAVPATRGVVEDNVYFSTNVMKTIDGTYPHSDPSPGPQGQVGPVGNCVGPTWARGGRDITDRVR